MLTPGQPSTLLLNQGPTTTSDWWFAHRRQRRRCFLCCGLLFNRLILGLACLTRRRSCSGSTSRRRVSASVFGVAGRWICGPGFAAGRGWTLWGDCLFGEPANARDRRADGAGGTTEFGVPDDSERSRLADGNGDWGRAGLCCCGCGSDARIAVWDRYVGRVRLWPQLRWCLAQLRCWRVISRRAERLR